MRRTPAMAVATLAAAALTLTACGRDDAGVDRQRDRQGRQRRQGHRHHHVSGPWAPRARSSPPSPRSSRPPTPAPRSTSPRSRGTRRTRSSPPRSRPAPRPTPPWSAPPGWVSSPASTRSTRRPRRSTSRAFFEGAQKTTEVNGTSYGVPWYVETRLVYYRTDLAKKAGITEAPDRLGRPQGDGQGHAGQGRREVRHGLPGRRHRLVAVDHAVRLVQRRRPHQGRRQGLQLRQPRRSRRP